MTSKDISRNLDVLKRSLNDRIRLLTSALNGNNGVNGGGGGGAVKRNVYEELDRFEQFLSKVERVLLSIPNH